MIFDTIRESHDLQRDPCRKVTASSGDTEARELLFLQTVRADAESRATASTGAIRS